VEVAKGDICSARIKQAGGFCFLAAHNYAAFGEFGDLAACDMKVASKDERKITGCGDGAFGNFCVE